MLPRLLFLFTLLLPALRLTAQGSNLLDVTSRVAPSIVFTQKYAESVVDDPANGPAQVAAGSFTVKIVASLQGVDLSAIDESTAVGFSCGTFTDSHALGDDPGYVAGNRSATFTIPGAPSDPNDPNSPPADAGSVTYVWTNTALTITATGLSLDAGVIADATLYPDGQISDSTDATVDFGGGAGTHQVTIGGTHRTTTVTAGTGDNAQDFSLASATVTGVGGYFGPRLSMAPLPARTLSGQVAVSITSDGANVTVALNDGSPLALTADPQTGLWQTTLTLKSGANHLEVLADDGGSGLSAIGADIFYTVPTTVSVSTVGNGTVTKALRGSTQHSIGEILTITATPAAGQIFAGWSGDAVSASPALTFTVTQDMSLTATFQPSPFVAVSGTYTASLSGAPAGALRLQLSPGGGFTGKVLIGGKAWPLLGFFLPDGTARLQIKTDAFHPALQLAFSFDLTGGTNALSGTVQFAGTSSGATFTASLSGGAPPAGVAGAWTVVLRSPDSDFPSVAGYATMKVKASGAATLAGRVTDGVSMQRLSAGGQIGSDALLHLYTPLYPHNKVRFGALSGDVRFASGCSGSLTLFVEADRLNKLSGPQHTVVLNRALALSGSHYIAPHPGAATLAIASDLNAFNIVKSIVVSARGTAVVTNPGADAAILSLNLKTGWFAGAFLHPTPGVYTGFTGVYESSAGEAAGSYVRMHYQPGSRSYTGDFGSVTLKPVP